MDNLKYPHYETDQDGGIKLILPPVVYGLTEKLAGALVPIEYGIGGLEE